MKGKVVLASIMAAAVVLSGCGSSAVAAVGTSTETATENTKTETTAENTETTLADNIDTEESAEAESTATDAIDKNILTVDGGFDVSAIKDKEAAEIFKNFLTSQCMADFDGKKASLGDLLMATFEVTGDDNADELMTDYLIDNYAVNFVISEVKEPVLYVEVRNVLVGGTVYQIKIKDKAPYVNSFLNTGWSDSTTVYTNGIIGIYHGMSLPTVDSYFDATDALVNIYDGKSKVKLIIFGPESAFDATGYEEAFVEYTNQAENVLAFEDEITEDITEQRDKILGISDKDAIEWTKLAIVDFKE